METIGSSRASTAFAGQNSTANNSTLVQGISSFAECNSASNNDSPPESSGISGVLDRVGNAVSGVARTAACKISSAVSPTLDNLNAFAEELDAARGYLDNSEEESPGQTNLTLTTVNVSRPIPPLVNCSACARSPYFQNFKP